MSLRLPDTMRDELKIPLGRLSAEDPSSLLPRLRRETDCLIAVGDVSTYAALSAGIRPNLAIFDHRKERVSVDADMIAAFDAAFPDRVRVPNPAGTITGEAVAAIKAAMAGWPAAIEVAGEEDLLVLPCMAEAPLGAMVVYGQPKQGLVMVRIDDPARKRARELMEKMEKI